jgi:restriction system protein
MTVWLIRAGKFGERDQWCLEKGYAAGGWREVADLTDATTRPKVRKLVEDAFPTQPAAFHANHTGQLHALRNRIAVGDIVVLPLKTTRHLALGTVSCGYRYLADEADPDRRHTIGVEWTRTDVPRTAIKQDLLYSLGAFLTVCEISRNDGAWRLQQVLETGQDPGARSSVPTQATDDTEDSDPSDSSATEIDVVQVAADRIQVAIGERFAGYRLAELVAAVLRAEGYACDTSPPGPDGGVDIVAGRGPLGLDEPTVAVQVKSQASPVGAHVVDQLLGVCAALQAKQALLVAWGGLTKPARAKVKAQRLNLRVWEVDDLLAKVLATYPLLGEAIRTELPLKQVWVLAEESG